MREEIAALLREAATGNFRFVDETWDETFAGNCSIRVGDATVTIFNDCDGLDYVDHAAFPDGREWDYSDGPEVLALLNWAEVERLEAALKAAS